MGWERRQRGGLYYTRSRRVRGRVVREYVGGGLAGFIAEQQDREARCEAAKRKHEWTVSTAQLEARDQLASESEARIRWLTHGTLVLAGYRQHHRGDWRKHRG
jgi:hypothetical protein